MYIYFTSTQMPDEFIARIRVMLMSFENKKVREVEGTNWFGLSSLVQLGTMLVYMLYAMPIETFSGGFH